MKTMLNQELSDLVKITVQAAKKGKPILLFSSKLMNHDHDFVVDFVVDTTGGSALCLNAVAPFCIENAPFDCESFARRTFTTPKFGHYPPPKTNICQEDNCHPQFFLSFFGLFFLAFSTYSSWRTSRMGRRRCLTRWSWSTSSRGCVTRWSWSTSSRRCLTSWSWSTSSRGRRWKRSPRW